MRALKAFERTLLAVVLLAVLCAVANDAGAWGSRSAHQRYLFRKAHPCPVTQSTKGACPNYVIDHVIPLCAHGPDRRSNMQWQPVPDSAVKDMEERRLCSAIRAGTIPPHPDKATLCTLLPAAQWPQMSLAVCK